MPNTQETLQAIDQAEDEINNWLFKMTHGETSIGFSKVSASSQDFVTGNFQRLWQRVGRFLEYKKFSKLDMNRYGGIIKNYLDGFRNDLKYSLCPLCGKNPSDPSAEGSQYLKDVVSSCALCRDQVFIGTNIVKKERLAIFTTDSDLHDKEDSLLEPIFGKYQLTFRRSQLDDLAKEGKLIKYWEILRWPRKQISSEVSIKFINGYVPVYGDDDLNDDRILWGKKTEKKKLEEIEQIELGDPKTFAHISSKALKPIDEKGTYCGLDALGIMKADVDNLGLIMGYGLKNERYSLSRLATLSRQLDLFFSCFLPDFIASQNEFRDIYTVFAGGDDLFLIGPWNRIVELAPLINKRFTEYVCNNQEIHLSAGIVLCKPHMPIDIISNLAEESLEKSKEGQKNQLTIFSETVSWDYFPRIHDITESIKDWLDKGWITRSLLYRLNNLVEMVSYEKRVVKKQKFSIDDMKCTKWRAYLSYLIERNFARRESKEQRSDLINKAIEIIFHWMDDLGGAMKIPLWYILYNIRGG